MTDTDTIREALKKHHLNTTGVSRSYNPTQTYKDNQEADAALAALDTLVAALERGDSLLDQCGREHAAMFVRVEAAEAERDELERIAYEANEGEKILEDRVTVLEAALRDFAERGTRFDCNPTVIVHNTPEWVASQEWWQNRATQMDVAVRNRARAALAPTKEDA